MSADANAGTEIDSGTADSAEEKPLESPRRLFRHPGMGAVFAAAWVVFGCAMGFGRLSDNSYFWHLRTGRWILDHGFPAGDPFSYTAPEAHWVLQSWLAEVLYAGLDRLAGPMGVRVLCAITGGITAYLAYRLVLRIGGDHVKGVFLNVPAVLATAMLWGERPLFLGILAFLLLVWVVELPDSGLGRRPLIWIPLIIMLWANVHGSWVLGGGYLVLHLLGRWLEGSPPWRGRELRLLQGSLIALVLCFANPYGYEMVTFPFHLMGMSDFLANVAEWGSPDFRTPQGALFAAWTAVVVGVFALAPNRPSRRDVVVAIPFLLLGMWALRNIAVAPLVTLPITARLLARPRPDPGRRTNWMLIAAIVTAGSIWVGNLATKPNYELDDYPVAAMHAMQDRGLLGQRLFTSDVWGAYTLLEYSSKQKVFIDDRYDMYPKKLLFEYLDVLNVQPNWEKVLDEHRVSVVMWHTEHPLTRLLDLSPHWQRVYQDKTASVYVRK
ncbi:hypothetical protein [Actinomadura chokoriensis]|uniref:Glycosyltransferase RgtA/B/C/D-like domain-containing protein n=1 Tax=Actinomadura chokoriensis TaxID=454156 RepID=A0ABV4QNX1_9ACTN